jgi:hypothetical protein
MRTKTLGRTLIAGAVCACTGCSSLDIREALPNVRPSSGQTLGTSPCLQTLLQTSENDSVPDRVKFVKRGLDIVAGNGDSDTPTGGVLGKVLDSVAKRLTNKPGEPIESQSVGQLDMQGLAQQVHGQVTQSPLTLALKSGELSQSLNKTGTTATSDAQKDEDNAKLLALVLYYYLDALFNNQYVDRMGTPIPAPTLSGTVSDGEISSVVTVFVDALMDFVNRRPIWVEAGTDTSNFDPAAYAKANKHYYPYMGDVSPTSTAAAAKPAAPAASAASATPATPASGTPASGNSKNAEPTAVAFEFDGEIQKAQPSVKNNWAPIKAMYPTPASAASMPAADATAATDTAQPAPAPADAPYCGLDEYKAKAVYYVSQLVNQGVSGMTGLTVGSFGGVGFSLGVFGKFSFGDNQTVEAVLKAILARLGQRVATDAALKILWDVDDSKLVFPSGTLVIRYLSVAKTQ